MITNQERLRDLMHSLWVEGDPWITRKELFNRALKALHHREGAIRAQASGRLQLVANASKRLNRRLSEK